MRVTPRRRTGVAAVVTVASMVAGATFSEPLSTPPDAKTPLRAHTAPDSERPAGDWNTCDIVCLGDTIEVVINGVLQNRATRCSLSEGRVGFQLEGTPFELRNVSVTPIPPGLETRPPPDEDAASTR